MSVRGCDNSIKGALLRVYFRAFPLPCARSMRSTMILASWISVTPLLFASTAFAAFNPSANTNLVAYWGQNSFGATNPTDTANWQTNLATYCQDDTVDVFPLAFLDVFFDTGGLPSINFANTCNDVDDEVFPGSDLANCQFMASDIETCQAAGKIITLSMGGATGADTFTSDDQAVDFANLIWDLFLGGTSGTRPFGNAVLDGIDLDIEGGGSAHFAAFVTQIRSLAQGAGKTYYFSAAPQCPFPDANLDTVINAVGFDFIYVQFYNNFCEVSNFNVAGDWDYSSWDNWAKTTSPNPDVKIYIGAPAAPSAASNGYVAASTLATILQQTKAEFSSFGGAMLWDISQAVANGRYDAAVKTALLGGGSAPTTSIPGSTTKPATSTHTTTTTTSIATNGNCAGIAAWSSSVAYPSGSQVTFGGDLWTSNQWSEAETPGGAAGAWVNDGACVTDATRVPAAASSASASVTGVISQIGSSAAPASSASVKTQPSAAAASSAAAPTASASAASVSGQPGTAASSAVSASASASVKAQPSAAAASSAASTSASASVKAQPSAQPSAAAASSAVSASASASVKAQPSAAAASSAVSASDSASVKAQPSVAAPLSASGSGSDKAQSSAAVSIASAFSASASNKAQHSATLTPSVVASTVSANATIQAQPSVASNTTNVTNSTNSTNATTDASQAPARRSRFFKF